MVVLSSVDKRTKAIRGNDCRGQGPGHISMRRYAEPPKKTDVLVGFRVVLNACRGKRAEGP